MFEYPIGEVVQRLAGDSLDPNTVTMAECKKAVAGLSSANVRQAAALYLHAEAHNLIRQRVLKVERAAKRERKRFSPISDDNEDLWDQFFSSVNSAVAQFEQAMRLELTAELLGAAFALPDGSTVTWGEATIEEHQQRRSMLVDHAEGTLETATQHGIAIEMLRAAGAVNLNGIAEAA